VKILIHQARALKKSLVAIRKPQIARVHKYLATTECEITKELGFSSKMEELASDENEHAVILAEIIAELKKRHARAAYNKAC